VLNLDNPDPEMTGVEIPKDFMQKVYLARCAFSYTASCSTLGGK